jgi:hypothetical protein
MSFTRIKITGDSWHNDHLQFARLLSELVAAGAPNRKQMAELCESMDLSVENINEILDRAQEAWEDVKSRT